MYSFKLGEFVVSDDFPTFIIAEAGVNHNGKLSLAKEMVDVAAEAGANAIKFQSFRADELVTSATEKADYQKDSEQESQLEMLKRLELSEEEFLELKSYCSTKGILFLSTPFDLKSADMLEKLDVLAYKISSGDLTNYSLLTHVAKKGKPIILSTGMGNWDEIAKAIETVISTGNSELALLQCTTGYPVQFGDVHLKVIPAMQKKFGFPVGFSDHTLGLEASIAAVALGAKIVEKHFTLDKSLPGPDHKASLSPDELSALVSSIRNVEAALGNQEKTASFAEKEIMGLVRRKIVAAQDILEGAEITEPMLAFKRAESGLDPSSISQLVGKRTLRTIKKDEIIDLDGVR